MPVCFERATAQRVQLNFCWVVLPRPGCPVRSRVGSRVSQRHGAGQNAVLRLKPPSRPKISQTRDLLGPKPSQPSLAPEDPGLAGSCGRATSPLTGPVASGDGASLAPGEDAKASEPVILDRGRVRQSRDADQLPPGRRRERRLNGVIRIHHHLVWERSRVQTARAKNSVPRTGPGHNACSVTPDPSSSTARFSVNRVTNAFVAT